MQHENVTGTCSMDKQQGHVERTCGMNEHVGFRFKDMQHGHEHGHEHGHAA
jgi:hypothetical protein